MEEKIEWRYKGAVEVNGKLNDSDYQATTFAATEKEARRNISYQYKKDVNLPSRSKVKLISDFMPEKMYIFEGNVYLNGKVTYVDYRDYAYAFNENAARMRVANKFRRRQYLSDDVDITLEGKITEKEK